MYKRQIIENGGVQIRYFAEDETVSDMGADAALSAVIKAGLQLDEIGAIIGASSAPEQAIPSTSALLHKKLGLTQTPTFDVNATCLSFLTALDLASYLVDQGRYENVLIVSSEIASRGLNKKDLKTATLFGDGAAAAVVGRCLKKRSGICCSKFETWSENQDACLLEVGGSRLYGEEAIAEEKNFFQMDGPKLYKAIAPKMGGFLEGMLEDEGLEKKDLSLVIPHQASPFGLRLLERKFDLEEDQFFNVVKQYGNMIAASLPFSLHLAIESGRLKRGDKMAFMGTSAGLSIGGMILEY